MEQANKSDRSQTRLILRWALAIVVLPGSALVFVPGALLLATRGTAWAAAPSGPTGGGLGAAAWWVGIALLAPGMLFAWWSVGLFARHGKGTAAPWDPPQRLVVRGPYRHVRNPMLSGAIMLATAEALLAGSWVLAAWAALFALANVIYFPLVEEPGLRARFGEPYREYCRHVPRWLPRLRPWAPPDAGEDGGESRSSDSAKAE